MDKKENRGGKRQGAGRPKANTIVYFRRVDPNHVELLDRYLKSLKTP